MLGARAAGTYQKKKLSSSLECKVGFFLFPPFFASSISNCACERQSEGGKKTRRKPRFVRRRQKRLSRVPVCVPEPAQLADLHRLEVQICSALGRSDGALHLLVSMHASQSFLREKGVKMFAVIGG